MPLRHTLTYLAPYLCGIFFETPLSLICAFHALPGVQWFTGVWSVYQAPYPLEKTVSPSPRNHQLSITLYLGAGSGNSPLLVLDCLIFCGQAWLLGFLEGSRPAISIRHCFTPVFPGLWLLGTLHPLFHDSS